MTSTASASPNRPFRVGEWHIDPRANTLIKGEVVVRAEPKVMDALVCLAGNPGEVVTREQLLACVWPGVVVSDEVITRAISELRTLLGDTERERRYIRTIPKRGYSLIAPVVAEAGEEPELAPPTPPAQPAPADQPRRPWPWIALAVATTLLLGLTVWRVFAPSPPPAPPAPPTSAQTHAARPPSVAVLPLVDLSPEGSHPNFDEGLAEDIRSALVNVPGLRVISRTSSQAFAGRALDVREIGRQLGVDALIEGTVRVAGDRVRVTLQMTDVASGFPTWSEVYDRTLTDVFRVQHEIAQAVAAKLAPPGAVTADQEDLPAREHYLLGRHFWHQRTAAAVQLAIERFQQGIAIAPDYAPLHAGLADAYIFAYRYGDMPRDAAVAAAQAAVARALALDPNLAEALATQGLLFQEAGDQERAKAAYARAVAARPGYSMARMWYGNALLLTDQPLAAYRQYQSALEQDPLHPTIQRNLLEALKEMGEYAKVIDLGRRMAELDGDERLLIPVLSALVRSGRLQEFHTELQRRNFNEPHRPDLDLLIAHALLQLRRFDDLQALLERGLDPTYADFDWQLRVEAAVAQRDAARIRELVQSRPAAPTVIELKRGLTADCLTALQSYWLGLADFMQRDYPAATAQFETADAHGFSHCPLYRDVRITLYLYLAAARAQGGAVAPDHLAPARAALEDARKLGWSTASLITSSLGLSLLSGDRAQFANQLADLRRENLHPWGTLLNEPLFDRYREDPEIAALLQPLATAYERTQAALTPLSLAKYGLPAPATTPR